MFQKAPLVGTSSPLCPLSDPTEVPPLLLACLLGQAAQSLEATLSKVLCAYVALGKCQGVLWASLCTSIKRALITVLPPRWAVSTQEGPQCRAWLVPAQSAGSTVISHYYCTGLALPPARALGLPGLEWRRLEYPQGPDPGTGRGGGSTKFPRPTCPLALRPLAPAHASPRATAVSKGPLSLSGPIPGFQPCPGSYFPPRAPTTSRAQVSLQAPSEGARCGINPHLGKSSNPSSATSQLCDLRQLSLSLSLLICYMESQDLTELQ